MESTRLPIRHAPLSLILVATRLEPVEALVAAWLPFVENSPPGSQLIVIADHPIECRTAHGRLRIVFHTRPMGVGASLQTGVWSLETPLAFFVSTNSSLSREQASDFLERIDMVDLVVGCPRTGPTPMLVRTWERIKGIVSRIFLGYTPEPRLGWPGWGGWWRRWVARHLFGVPLIDPECGVLLGRSEIFLRIPIQSKGEFAWVEWVAKANHLGCLLDEVGVDAAPGRRAEFARDAWRVFRRPDFGAARQKTS